MTPTKKAKAPQSEEFFSLKEAAEYVGVSVTTLRRYDAQGTGPKVKKTSRKTWRFRRTDVDAWMADGGAEKTAQAS